MNRLLRFACVAVGVAAFLLAEVLGPSDDDWQQFADNPDAWPLLYVQEMD